jgi:hypothetical protein
MYTLDLARLPSLLPVPLATKILNTGRTLLLLRDEVNSLHAGRETGLELHMERSDTWVGLGVLQDEQSAEGTVMDLLEHVCVQPANSTTLINCPRRLI